MNKYAKKTVEMQEHKQEQKQSEKKVKGSESSPRGRNTNECWLPAYHEAVDEGRSTV